MEEATLAIIKRLIPSLDDQFNSLVPLVVCASELPLEIGDSLRQNNCDLLSHLSDLILNLKAVERHLEDDTVSLYPMVEREYQQKHMQYYFNLPTTEDVGEWGIEEVNSEDEFTITDEENEELIEYEESFKKG